MAWNCIMQNGYTYHGGSSRIDWTEVNELFQAVGLGERDPRFYPEVCRGSYACVFAEHDGHTIGMGRIISDGVRSSALFDMAVHPRHQGCGVGRKIIELLHEKLPAEKCLIYATPGKEEFYERFGYHRCKTGMLLTPDPAKARRDGYI